MRYTQAFFFFLHLNIVYYLEKKYRDYYFYFQRMHYKREVHDVYVSTKYITMVTRVLDIPRSLIFCTTQAYGRYYYQM